MITVVRYRRNLVAVEDGVNVLRIFRGRNAWKHAKTWATRETDETAGGHPVVRVVRLR